MFEGPRLYTVSRAARKPLLNFMLNAVQAQGCRIIYASQPDHAPFVFTFETRTGERFGVIAYVFLATRTPTTNRPADERSFQLKYSSKSSYGGTNSHQIWQDPFGLYTTLLVGISPDEGFFVAADPEMHNPTKFFIRIEFKDRHAAEIKQRGWVAWEREHRGHQDEPVEVLVGGTTEHFLDLIKLERAARGLDQGNRQLLAEKRELFTGATPPGARELADLDEVARHPLVKELALSADEIMDVISGARRLKMAVRGWVAEEHLRAAISKTAGVTLCEKIDKEGGPDLNVRLNDGPILTMECKNVLRVTNKEGTPRLDFQRTRTSKTDHCSRYYAPTDFDVVAACLHAVTESWEFKYILPQALDPHRKCEGKLSNNVLIGANWNVDPVPVFQAAAAMKG
jgi:hypothetical protein